MRFCCCPALFLAVVAMVAASQVQTDSPSSSSSKHARKPASASASSSLDGGVVSNGIYRNRELGFSCRIPAAWVLRTDEMNARDDDGPADQGQADPAKADEKGRVKSAGRVLLAAFSRPPLATGQDVNSSILIAAESVGAYPGLKEAVQYFGPLTEVAKAQGFAGDGEPYEIAVGTKALVREDFHKDVGSRVMRQSTLVLLAHGYAVSFTFIGGTEEEVEELMDGLSFTATRTVGK